MVFQSYALYPHMTVRENLGYGLKVRRAPKQESRERVAEVAQLLGLEELLDRKPAQLSGGQRQRVAMGRAIVREPRAFLMDEPLSNLDAKLRVGMRASLAQLHAKLGVTTVYVTHDQTEAMTLGQRVAVLRDGAVVQADRPQELYAHPRDVFVAAFIGAPAMNLVEATVDGGVVRFGQYVLPLDPACRPHRSGPVVLGIRPEAFADADGRAGRASADRDLGRGRGGARRGHARLLLGRRQPAGRGVGRGRSRRGWTRGRPRGRCSRPASTRAPCRPWVAAASLPSTPGGCTSSIPRAVSRSRRPLPKPRWRGRRR